MAQTCIKHKTISYLNHATDLKSFRAKYWWIYTICIKTCSIKHSVPGILPKDDNQWYIDGLFYKLCSQIISLQDEYSLSVSIVWLNCNYSILLIITVLLTSFHSIILFLKLFHLLLKLVQSLSGKTRNNNVYKFILYIKSWVTSTMEILKAREMLKSVFNLILLPNILTGNSNSFKTNLEV